MIKVIEELLSSGAIEQSVADKIETEVSSIISAKNEENKTLRLDKEAMAKNYAEVEKSKSDLETQLSGLDAKIEEAKKAGQSEMVTQLEAEKSKHKDLQDSLSNLQKTNTKLKLDNAVAQELDKFDIRKDDKELVGFRLRANVSLGEDGSIVYNDGDNTTDLTGGFNSYFETNKQRLNPAGDDISGSGSSSGGGGGANTVERKAFDKMTPSAKADFVSKGGKVA